MKLVCQECRGAGEFHEVVLEETQEGPYYPCGWCNGSGYVTPKMRGLWLRLLKEEKKLLQSHATVV